MDGHNSNSDGSGGGGGGNSGNGGGDPVSTGVDGTAAVVASSSSSELLNSTSSAAATPPLVIVDNDKLVYDYYDLINGELRRPTVGRGVWLTDPNTGENVCLLIVLNFFHSVSMVVYTHDVF